MAKATKSVKKPVKKAGNTKRFLGAWQEGFYEKPGTEIHTMSWFNSSRGYSKEDILQIKNLRIGEFIEPDMGHIVLRTE